MPNAQPRSVQPGIGRRRIRPTRRRHRLSATVFFRAAPVREGFKSVSRRIIASIDFENNSQVTRTREWTQAHPQKESRFPAPAYGGRRLRSTACYERTTPLVPLAALDSPNRGRRVACGSMLSQASLSALSRLAKSSAAMAARRASRSISGSSAVGRLRAVW
jgi:hypothetical protein